MNSAKKGEYGATSSSHASIVVIGIFLYFVLATGGSAEISELDWFMRKSNPYIYGTACSELNSAIANFYKGFKRETILKPQAGS